MFSKPLASTCNDALAIRHLAVKHGDCVPANCRMAWWPANCAAREIADRGDIGKVWRVRGIVGPAGLDLNLQVVEILDAAKQPLKTGRAVKFAAR
jgi:hypothetical protein